MNKFLIFLKCLLLIIILIYAVSFFVVIYKPGLIPYTKEASTTHERVMLMLWSNCTLLGFIGIATNNVILSLIYGLSIFGLSFYGIMKLDYKEAFIGHTAFDILLGLIVLLFVTTLNRQITKNNS